MNEIEARTVLILRAFELPFEAPWFDADADAATREAAREVGEDASPDRFVSRRAAVAAGRLAERDAVAATALRSGVASIGASLAVVALVIAFGLGFAIDSIGTDGRVNLLAPPLLGLIVWNLAVYAALLLAWLRRKRRSTIHPLRALLTDTLQRWTSVPRRAAGPWLRFARDWSEASRPLQTQRISALLHGGAVAFACGALASLYLRGLAFEYRAGWDSTFLTPAAVHGWLSTLLGPASKLTRIPLPTTDALAALRFSEGPGENAARWIHLYAVTVGALVVWPRGWLGAAALRRARRLSADFPIDLRAPYFQRLLRGRGGVALRCQLLPYSHHPQARSIHRLTRLIERASGQSVSLRLLAPIDQGDEDDTARITQRVAGDDSLLFLLFTLTATPERETHGKLLNHLRAIRPQRATVLLIDEAAFAQRFAATMPSRMAERRAAWKRMLLEVECVPVFVDLETAEPANVDAEAAAIEAAIESAAT